jgi:hypothetical protein
VRPACANRARVDPARARLVHAPAGQPSSFQLSVMAGHLLRSCAGGDMKSSVMGIAFLLLVGLTGCELTTPGPAQVASEEQANVVLPDAAPEGGGDTSTPSVSGSNVGVGQGSVPPIIGSSAP